MHRTYRPGGVPELVLGVIAFAAAGLFGSFALYVWERARDGSPDGSLGPYVAFLFLAPVSALFALFGAISLLNIESKALSRKTGAVALLLGLVPFTLGFGTPGFAFNAALLLIALTSWLAVRLR